jgi:hypothetical protein
MVDCGGVELLCIFSPLLESSGTRHGLRPRGLRVESRKESTDEHGLTRTSMDGMDEYGRIWTGMAGGGL